MERNPNMSRLIPQLEKGGKMKNCPPPACSKPVHYYCVVQKIVAVSHDYSGRTAFGEQDWRADGLEEIQ